MAGKGGGSWKVAYADFVTAMMAFFLVMWIGAQDVKVRQSVANYFIDPSGVDKRPAKQGAILDSPVAGPVADANQVTGGRGSQVPPEAKPPGKQTSEVLSWIRGDAKRLQYWRAQIELCRIDASKNIAINETRTPEDIAENTLQRLLHAEFVKDVNNVNDKLFSKLLEHATEQIDFKYIAKDLMTRQ